MDGFKNTTRTHYMKGGSCDGYAKGGSVKGAAKISKVMGEFKRGELHSGSKKGPEVTSKKQATAIALSEARKAGAKIPQPVKKNMGGAMGSGRKQALATRASAASNEARNAQMARKPAPAKRGPAGAGFEAKPMVNKLSADKVEAMRDRMTTGMRKPAETLSATDSSPERQRAEADLKAAMQRDAEERNPMKPMVSGPPPMMKKGGLAAMPKGKKC